MKSFKCHKISDGRSEGPAIISTDDVMFYLIDPKTGVVIEEGHSLEHKSISGKIMIFPSGKGSSVVQADGLFQLMKENSQPKGMIEIPMVSQVEPEFYQTVKEGDTVIIDADHETVTIMD